MTEIITPEEFNALLRGETIVHRIVYRQHINQEDTNRIEIDVPIALDPEGLDGLINVRAVKPNENTGHGWVHPRPDGAHARCGGPRLCSQCASELAEEATKQ